MFSVLLSVYYKENPFFLRQSLDSVFTQTLPPDEVVLVEDGPLTEELDAVVKEYARKHPVLKVVPLSESRGLGRALDEGLKHCSYDLIARMDTDDISMPERFRMQVGYMRRHPDVAVVGGSIMEFNAACGCVGVRRYPETNDDVMKHICKACPCAHPAVMMRRKVFDKVSYDGRCRTSQDLALWFDILCAGFKINNMKDVVLKFRMDGDVFRRRRGAFAKNEFKIYCKGIRRLYGFFTWRYVWPLARYLFRLLPVGVIRRVYRGGVRRRVLQGAAPLRRDSPREAPAASEPLP